MKIITSKCKVIRTVRLEMTTEMNKLQKPPVGGVSILGHVPASDIEGKLSSRMMRQRSSDSSDSDALGNYDRARSGAEPASSAVSSGNVPAPENPAGNVSASIENSNSSGISMQPPSIDNTAGSGLW